MAKRFNIFPLMQGGVRLIPFRCIVQYRYNKQLKGDVADPLEPRAVITIWAMTSSGYEIVASKWLQTVKNKDGFSKTWYSTDVFSLPDKMATGVFAVIDNEAGVEIKSISFITKQAVIMDDTLAGDMVNIGDPGDGDDTTTISPPDVVTPRELMIMGDTDTPVKVGGSTTILVSKDGPESVWARLWMYTTDSSGSVIADEKVVTPWFLLESEYPVTAAIVPRVVTFTDEGYYKIYAEPYSKAYNKSNTLMYNVYRNSIIWVGKLDDKGKPISDPSKVSTLVDGDVFIGYTPVNQIFWTGDSSSSDDVMLASREEGDVWIKYSQYP